jgi:hypothetical protein
MITGIMLAAAISSVMMKTSCKVGQVGRRRLINGRRRINQMPMETKAPETRPAVINAKVDMLEVSKDILEHLGELGGDIASDVIPAQGQASLADLARTAAERMATLVNEVEGMPDDCFMMIDEPARKARNEARAKAKAEAKKRAEAEKKAKEKDEADAKAKEKAEAEAKAKAAMKGPEHAGGHQGRQGFQSPEEGRR